MVLRGHIRNGAVVLENPPADLPEGQEVRVEMVDAGTAGPSWHQTLAKFDGTAVDLPEDMAENLDHYLYGTPKRGNGD